MGNEIEKREDANTLSYFSHILDTAFTGSYDTIFNLTEKEWERVYLLPFWIFDIVAHGSAMIEDRELKEFRKFITEDAKYGEHTFVIRLFERIDDNYETFLARATAEDISAREELVAIAALIEAKVEPRIKRVLKEEMLILGFIIANAEGGDNDIYKKVCEGERDALYDIARIFNVGKEEIAHLPKHIIPLFNEYLEKR